VNNIYVETNFVLELVFEQEQHRSCEQILALCESAQSRLIIPAYCLAEPHEKLTRQAGSRRELQRNLETELRQLARTASYTTRINSIQDIASLLVRSNEEEKLWCTPLSRQFETEMKITGCAYTLGGFPGWWKPNALCCPPPDTAAGVWSRPTRDAGADDCYRRRTVSGR
jgi:predicted nucleic acid-binding protein